MIPSPIFISVILYGNYSNKNICESLIKTNLGPLFLKKDYINCSMYDNELTCNVYVSWRNACKCCSQLKDTFTTPVLRDILQSNNVSTTVECEFVNSHFSCIG
tara:strand:- start:10052 stop:10360 length:309 start_codon:yes stop_codon:yes gene_type:complete